MYVANMLFPAVAVSLTKDFPSSLVVIVAEATEDDRASFVMLAWPVSVDHDTVVTDPLSSSHGEKSNSTFWASAL